MARMDLDDVRSASVCIAFTESPGQAQGRGGRHTELGIALAMGLRVILIGPREHVFHCLPDIEQFDTWEEARDALGIPRPQGSTPAARPVAAVAGQPL